MGEDKEPSGLRTVEHIYELALKEFHNVFDYLDRIDQKLATIISVDAVIASILLPNEFLDRNGFISPKNILLLSGLIFVVISMAVCIRGYLERDFAYIDIEKMLKDYSGKEYGSATFEIARKLASMHKKNLATLKAKVRWMNTGFLFLLLGIVLILISKIKPL